MGFDPQIDSRSVLIGLQTAGKSVLNTNSKMQPLNNKWTYQTLNRKKTFPVLLMPKAVTNQTTYYATNSSVSYSKY